MVGKKNARKTSRDADYEEDGMAENGDENYASSSETKPIRGSRYDPPASPKSVMVRVLQVRKQVRKKVRKMKNAYLKIVPKNAPQKMPENPAMARVWEVRKSTQNCANSGTKSAQNETDKNAQFSVLKTRHGKAYRLILRYDLCELRTANSSVFPGKSRRSS
ncbi:TPA: hypothetical protein N2G38_002213 [Salmonella enterica]|nr:hypothetical protein [Salmonella enterica]